MKQAAFTILAVLSMSLLSGCAGGDANESVAPLNPPQQGSHNATQSAASMLSPVAQ